MTAPTNAAPLPAPSAAQRTLLIDATARSDGAISLPARLHGRAGLNVAEALLHKGFVREVRAKPDTPVWRTEPEGGRAFALVLTKAGRQAVATTDPDRGGPEKVPAVTPAPAPPAQEPAANETATAAPPQPAPAKPISLPRAGSKLDTVTALLRRNRGASLDEMVAATGWLPHTTRAALTGLRKRGFGVVRTRAEGLGGAVYHLGPAAARPA